jgi:xanthine dehydrogenase accessory factor
MDSVDTQVLKKADEWIRAGTRAVMGTVVRTWGSAPRPVGALVAIRADGQIVGSVSGGCIEDDLIDKIRTGAMALTAPQRVRYGISAEEATRFGLPCGGTLELVLEPLSAASKIDALLQRVAAGQQTARRLDLRTGEVALSEGQGFDALAVDEAALVSVHGPVWRLLIIGAGQLTQYLAEMALALDYQVIICDPREEYADAWSVPGTTLLRTMPDDTVIDLHPDAHTAVVALTHDPKLDDLALMEALRGAAFYVGAIGSRKNQEKRKERLKEFSVSDAQLERLHGPVGIKNGARTPPEIAVAILAELTGAKYGFRIPAPLPITAASAAQLEPGCSLAA